MKKKPLSIKEKVFKLLKKKKVAISKDKISRYLNLKEKSVNYAVKALKKEKKIGCLKQYAKCFPSYIEKTYYGVK